MAITRLYALPHPPLAVPGIGRGQERGISKTLAAFNEIAMQIADIAPETIIFITPHNVVYSDYFHISPGTFARGDFSRFGAPGIKLTTLYDEELAMEISRMAEQDGIPAGEMGERDPKLDHGTMVPMWFINNRYKDYATVRISQSGMEPTAHYRLGQAISRAVEATGRKTVFVASSDLSHKLTEDGPYGFAPEGPEFDEIVVQALAKGDFLTLLMIPEELRESAAQCGYNSLITLAGCLDARSVKPILHSYEGPFGVGYAVATFEQTGHDENRNILEKYEEASLLDARKKQETEDPYPSLARRSLEYAVNSGGRLPFPEGLPDEMLKDKAGVFVSLHKNGRLRGCIGTISPTTASVAREIIQNAVSAGLSDSRFEPVSKAELPYLTYKVDVLSAPEKIPDARALDVKRFGVIVTSGHKRGLLLPNLDGIDTVDEQIAIARRKAGIPDNMPINLERFEVVRHE
ncbi:MAG: AmmeMemoRadiSam system protein A [Oscillospiraceae bacterium]|nr:AmmeMemoRadiSam system protein A [Oscillospiraceae bacterium]